MATFILILCAELLLVLLMLLVFLDRQRKLSHSERLRLIEAGQSEKLLDCLHKRTYMTYLASGGIGIGMVVPIVAFLATAWVSREVQATTTLSLTAWICACVASITCSVCSVVLLFRLDTCNDKN